MRLLNKTVVILVCSLSSHYFETASAKNTAAAGACDCPLHHTETIANIKVPANMPLSADGKVSCTTCHTETTCPPKPTSAPLRNGPFKNREQFCFQCHAQAKKMAEDLNPHHPLTGTAESCLLCHTKDPKHATFADPQLKQKPEVLCLNCHESDLHLLLKEHLGRKPQAKTLANLKVGKAPIYLTEKNEITCATCHSPHFDPKLVDRHHGAGGEPLLAFFTHRTSPAKSETGKGGGTSSLSGNGTVEALCQRCHN